MTTKPMTLLKFVEEVTSRLGSHCDTLNRDKSTGDFATRLAVELLLINYWLRKRSDDPRIECDEEIRQELQSLLGKLVDICTWIPPGEASQDRENRRKEDFENGLQNMRGFKNENEWACQSYLCLFKLLDDKAPIPHGLKSYASRGCPKDQKRRLKSLRKFVKKNQAAKPQDLETDIDMTMEDYSPHICHLYDAVFKHCLCERSQPPENSILANLRLDWPDERSSSHDSSADEFSSDESSHDEPATDGRSDCSRSSVSGAASNSDTSMNFRILFLSHPHEPMTTKGSRWRDARIAISANSTGGRRRARTRHIQEYEDGFCGLISSPDLVWNPFVFDKGQLRFKLPRAYSRSFQLDRPSIPLNEIIKLPRQEFNTKMRYVLSYMLSRAVWEYYESNWMIGGWNKDAVHFMYETRDGERGLFVDKPFLHTKALARPSKNERKAGDRVHKFPKILALGIMLIEINMGIRIEDHRPKEKLTANTDAIAAQNMAESKEFRKLFPEECFKPVMMAIEFCMRPCKVVGRLSSRNTQEQRRHLYERVVTPLRKLGEMAFENLNTDAIDFPVPGSIPTLQATQAAGPEPDTVDPRPYLPANSPSECSRSQSGCSSSPEIHASQSEYSSLSGSMAQGAPGSSEGWFSKLSDLNNILRAKGEKTKPVKVAILDTGIGKDDYTRHSKNIKKCIDFVNKKYGPPTENSVDSHGSHIVDLVLKTFKDANIYVARVLEQSTLHNCAQVTAAQSRVAEAIEYATQEWSVDVIVMALGFDEEHSGMQDAIQAARCKSILVFAAASNYGNIGGIAFPARLHLDVLCMFCTDALAKVSQSINPEPSPNRTHNLAVLGEVSLPKPGGGTIPLKGTSMSTAIGAGLAARLIDFSRHKDNQEILGKQAAHLKSMAGMQSVFAKMARGKSGDGYYCVVPWNLLKDLGGAETTRAQKRERICHAIIDALGQRND